VNASTPLQILLVEDDAHLRAMLVTAISAHADHMVTAADRAETALRVIRESEMDVILLDLGLPDLDGTALIPLLKSASRAAIIVISARDTEAQKIAALDAGADDYLTKPFGIGELLARIRSTRRRTGGNRPAAPSLVVCGELLIDLDKREVTVAGVPAHMTPIEFRLLAALARRAGTVATHRQLLREVWGPSHEEDGHYLRIYMRQLRAKIERDPTQPRWLLNEAGVGYRLTIG
jgi:two-component system KDP operon response regulator KdpE